MLAVEEAVSDIISETQLSSQYALYLMHMNALAYDKIKMLFSR